MVKHLVMLRLRAVFGAMGGKNKNGEYKKPTAGKIVLLCLLYGYLLLAFGFMSVMISLSVGSLFVLGGEPEIFFALINIISFSLIFFLSIFETKSELFDCKDNELMLSMPIPSGSIVIARIIVVLVYNYLTQAIISLPAAVIYLILSGGELLGFFGSILTALVTPLAATALAAAVGYLVAIISKRVKNKTFITLFLSLAFLALYFVGYSALLGMDMGEEGSDIDVSALAGKLAILKPIGAASMLSPLPLIIYIAVCLVLAYLAYRIISAHYISIVTNDYSAKRTEYKAEKMKTATPLMALTKKELTRFVTSSTYMLNAALGIVFELVIAVFAVVKSSTVKTFLESLTAESGMPGASDSFVAVAICAGLVLLASMTTISAPSVSLEGKNLWLVKSMPIQAKTVLTAKALAHIIVATPPAVIASLIIAVTFGLSPIYTAACILVAILVNVFCAILGVVMNTAFPKFVYENEAQPIKQSLSLFLVMMIMMVLGMLLSVLGLVLAVLALGWLYVLLVFMLFAGLSVGFYFIMAYPCAKRFENFSVT